MCVINLMKCLLKHELNVGHCAMRILPGEWEDTVTVTFRDPQKKAVRVEKSLYRSYYLHTDELGFTGEDVAYITTAGGYADKIEIRITEPYGWDRNNFADSADVNIMVISATHDWLDQVFIERKFAGKSSRNVFFIIANFGLVAKEDKDEFFSRIKELLGSTFTDCNGNFDRELYEQRVFLTDLHTSAMARTGGEERYIKDGASFVRRVDPLENRLTGVPVFEMELKRFLEQLRG